jgi:hypothetical protein
VRKDVQKLIESAEAQGFTRRKTKDGHYMLFAPDGRPATTISGTPSDWREIRNARGQLRRAGYVEPPTKGKGKR